MKKQSLFIWLLSNEDKKKSFIISYLYFAKQTEWKIILTQLMYNMHFFVLLIQSKGARQLNEGPKVY